MLIVSLATFKNMLHPFCFPEHWQMIQKHIFKNSSNLGRALCKNSQSGEETQKSSHLVLWESEIQVISVSSTYQIRCASWMNEGTHEWMNEMNTVPLSLFSQYSPQYQRAPTKAVSCAHSERGSGPLVSQGRGATTETLVGVTQHLPRSLTEAQPVLGWLTLLCQRESPKACRMACHHRN